MRKLVLSLILVLFFLNLISALEVSSEYNSDVMVRGLDTPIDMKLTITNATHGVYNIYTLSDVSISPSDNFRIDENYFEKDFVIKSRESFDMEGKYAFTYTLNYRGVEKFDQKFVIDFVNLEDIIEVGSEYVDFDSGKISFYVKNSENVKISNIPVKFSSILFDVEKEISLSPKEKIQISIDVDKEDLKKTKAGVYIVDAVFKTSLGDSKVTGKLYLGEKKGITSTEDKSGILIRTHTINKVNTGNVVESVEFYATQNIISRFFTTFNIEPVSIERNDFFVTYTWKKDRLNPAEAYVIKIKTNYVLPFFVVLFLTLGLLWYKKYSETKLEIKKNVSHVRTKSGEFALRIHLEVKARKEVRNTVLSDKIPAMVKIYNKFGENSKPDKVDSKTRNLHWSVGDLQAGEIRLFNYIVYSKVGIVGKFMLPEARATFIKDSKKYKVTSNKVYFMSSQVTS